MGGVHRRIRVSVIEIVFWGIGVIGGRGVPVFFWGLSLSWGRRRVFLGKRPISPEPGGDGALVLVQEGVSAAWNFSLIEALYG